MVGGEKEEHGGGRQDSVYEGNCWMSGVRRGIYEKILGRREENG